MKVINDVIKCEVELETEPGYKPPYRDDQEILTELDYERKYAPKGVDCPICKNKGGIPSYNKETKLNHWTPCSCMQNKKTLLNIQQSGLGELLNYKVNDFKVTEPYQKVMKDKTVDYIRNATKEWFLALGQSGSGKTMLCSAICNQRLREGRIVRYMIWPEFMSEYKTMKNDGEKRQYLYDYLKAEILYIDDLLKGGSPTDYDLKVAFEAINYRYNNKLITIISSELVMTELCELDEAAASRMFERADGPKGDKGYVITVKRGKEKNYRLKDLQGQLDLK